MRIITYYFVSTMYIAPTLTVDFILFAFDQSYQLNVLLITRAREPFEWKNSLPGWYVNVWQTTLQALEKKISQKTWVNLEQLSFLEQLYTFDSTARDPRWHSVSVTRYWVCRMDEVWPLTWETPHRESVDILITLAFDHIELIELARKRLKDKMRYSNCAYALLPKSFLFEQLLLAYQAVDTTKSKDEIEEFIKTNWLIKENKDQSFSFKIQELLYLI